MDMCMAGDNVLGKDEEKFQGRIEDLKKGGAKCTQSAQEKF